MNYDDYKLEAEPIEEENNCVECDTPCEGQYCSTKCYQNNQI